MDSSSDGSFAWTDASNDTIDSGARFNDNMNKVQSEDESVSGKGYKRKLQEELFAQSNGVVEKELQLNPNKQKRRRTEGQSDSEQASPKKKKIKREPESDIDTSVTKHKTNGHNHSESHDSYDECYLDLKVKAEEQFAAPLAKTKKKKKSKKRKHSISDETNHQESLLEGGETPEDGSGSPPQYAEEQEANITTQVKIVQDTKEKKKKSSNRDHDDCRDEDTGRQMKQQPDTPVNRSVSFNTLSKSVNRSPRISERIQFEEDESSETETSQLQSTKQSTKSSKLKTYLKNNINLKPFTSKFNAESMLSADDEVWIIRCPKDVDIDAFQNKDLMLQGKCKLKLNGQTYEGAMDDESGNVSILSLEQSNFIIKSHSVKGCLNLRKRIPKSQIHDETSVRNQTNFIPLPETKCRHPLFGSNYRKAIKVSARLAERLRARPGASAQPLLSALKPEPRPESSMKPELETDQEVISKKKKKKRKRLGSEEIASNKKKRMKHNLESAEAWESEQAIEENLFNF